MSIELEQLRKVAHQTDIGYLRDDGTVETISLSAILARMDALEKVYSDATKLTLRGARTTCRSITEIVENVNGHEWNWLLESLAEVPK